MIDSVINILLMHLHRLSEIHIAWIELWNGSEYWQRPFLWYSKRCLPGIPKFKTMKYQLCLWLDTLPIQDCGRQCSGNKMFLIPEALRRIYCARKYYISALLIIKMLHTFQLLYYTRPNDRIVVSISMLIFWFTIK